MKKIAIALAGTIVFLIGFITIIINANKDSVGPNITVEAEGIKYSPDCKDKALIKGAKAVDEQDGDVSDTLEIVGRTVIKENETEIVEYVACDKSGNVSTKKMVFTMIGEETFQVSSYDDYEVDYDNLESSIQVADKKAYLNGSKEKEEVVSEKTTTKDADDKSAIADNDSKLNKDATGENISGSNEETDGDNKDGQVKQSKEPSAELTKEPTKEPTKKPTNKPTKKPTKEPTKAPTKKPTEAPTKQPTNSRPTIVLKTNDITVRRGSSSTVYLNCIREIKDDKDSSEQLFRKVGMTRGLSLRVAGTYTQGLYCVDSDGNRSNVAVITVHVR